MDYSHASKISICVIKTGISARLESLILLTVRDEDVQKLSAIFQLLHFSIF